MHSQVNLSSKKARSIIKTANTRKTFSSRSNTQDIPHHNRPKKSSSCNPKKNKNINTSIFNTKTSKEDFPKKFIGLNNINISTKINSNTNSNANTDINNTKNVAIYKFKEILNQKDKKIAELETQIKIYKDKLKNQIRIFNINSSTNSFNLSKTRSSTNVNERNLYQIHSLSKSHAKIKNSFQSMTRNIPKGVSGQNNAKNVSRSKNKKRSKSNNFNYSSNNNLPKPKINTQFFWSKNSNDNNNIKAKGHVNNFKRNNFNSSQKNKNKYDDSNMKYKRAKSSNVEKNKRTNNMGIINVNMKKINNNKDLDSTYGDLMTVEETQMLCDRMIEKIKSVLELVKKATTED